MHLSASHQSLSHFQRIALAGLLLCVALAQSLTFAHRTLHQDVRMLAHAYAEAHDGADCEHDHNALHRLFANHEQGDENCRLLDASNTFFDQNQPLALVLPALNAHVLIAFNTGWLSAWHAPLFEARAPPVFSL